MFSARIKNWLKKYEKYLFYYKDGYFVLPYLNNSPRLMIESMASMPFAKHNESDQIITSSNPFSTGELRYKEIETGLWLMVSSIEFKANVNTKSVFDSHGSDYYFLAFSVFQNQHSNKPDIKINNEEVPSNSWAIYGPGISIEAFHLKGTRGLFFNFAFNSKWISDNLSEKSNGVVKRLVTSEAGFLVWKGLLPETEKLALEIWYSITGKGDQILDKIQLKVQTLNILTLFFGKILQENNEGQENESPPSPPDHLMISKKYLENHLNEKFPGIEYLAEISNLSPSKLKSDFKRYLGLPIYKFFNELQMHDAKARLLQSDIQIKNLAGIYGYESPSKFTKSFFKKFGKLPSDMKK